MWLPFVSVLLDTVWWAEAVDADCSLEAGDTLPITGASLGTSAMVLWLRRRSCGYGRVRANEPRQHCGCDGRTGSRCTHVEVVLTGCWGAAQDARTWSRSALGEPGSAV